MKDLFGTAINCIDGRVQEPVTELMKEMFGVDYVDVITEPGPDKVLFDNIDSAIIESIKKRVLISAEKHGSKVIVVAGHHDCAVNPVSEQDHKTHIRGAVKTINGWGLGSEAHGVWVDENWQADLL